MKKIKYHNQIWSEKDKNILLKARLRNYLLFEGFLTSPDRAKEQLDQAMAGLVNSIKS